MDNGKKWATADAIVGIIGGLAGIIGIITSIKSGSYNDSKQFEQLEERYGLKPINKD